MLRQSIDNIELERLESDFAGHRSAGKSQTPTKMKAKRSSLVGYSSSKKVSQFETPKAQLSQVKLKHVSQTKGEESSQQPEQSVSKNVEQHSEVRRKLILNRGSSILSVMGS